jgi:hypothetical protein
MDVPIMVHGCRRAFVIDIIDNIRGLASHAVSHQVFH